MAHPANTEKGYSMIYRETLRGRLARLLRYRLLLSFQLWWCAIRGNTVEVVLDGDIYVVGMTRHV